MILNNQKVAFGFNKLLQKLIIVNKEKIPNYLITQNLFQFILKIHLRVLVFWEGKIIIETKKKKRRK